MAHQPIFHKAHKDFKGDELCDSCWNGRHWHYAKNADGNGRKLVIDCKGEKCECDCRELLSEKHPKVKKTHEGQMLIDTGEDVIRIGSPKHNDQG